MLDDNAYMDLALEEASKAYSLGEVPIGAIIVQGGIVTGRGFNLRETNQDPTAHAELLAIKDAASHGEAWRLTGATLYVTLEPCLMCMGAIILARIPRLVYGPGDPKGGAAGTLYDVSKDPRLNHEVEVLPGCREAEGRALLQGFFRELRARKKMGS